MARSAFETLTTEFANFGRNYGANVRKVMPDQEMQKVVRIYESGLNAAMNGLTQMLREQYDGLSEEQRLQLDRTIELTGVNTMLQTANELVGESLFTVDAIVAAARIFPKVKDLIRKYFGIEPNSWKGWILDWIDRIIENIVDIAPKAPPAPPPPPPPPPKSEEKPAGLQPKTAPPDVAPVTPGSKTQK